MERYNEILKAMIGIPELEVKVNNPFPVKGSTVSLVSKSRWLREHNYRLNDGNDESTEAITTVLGESTKNITFNNTGEITQIVSGTNASGVVEVRKNIYVGEAANEPYFSVSVDKEIIRNDGEETRIILTADNGYIFNRKHIVQIYIYKENEETNPVKTISELTLTDGELRTNGIFLTERGIYDVEAMFTDIENGTTFIKRINKLITVTAALAPRLEAVELIVPAKANDIDLSGYAPGTTLVLMDDPKEPIGYMRRLRINNINGTKEKPIVITIDRDTPMEIAGNLYQGIWIGNAHHVIIDGRGYQNIKKGIKIYRYPGERMTMGVQIGGGTSVIEMFEVEIGEVDFAGLSTKTDPNANQPEYWFGNFEMTLSVHHCYIHDTEGEGMYLGYYGSGMLSGTNTAGEKVTYRAHSMQNTRVYRNFLENIGYDSIQLNNARASEICYNTIHRSGIRGESDQASGFSLSFQGRIYNNIINYYLGPGIQFAPLGRIEIFNNIISNGPDGSAGLLILSDRSTPEMNTSGTDINADILIVIHNNVLMSRGIGINARDVIQFMNVHIVDNFLIYKTSLLGGQQTQAITSWQDNMKGNHVMQFKEIDYDTIDALKVADSANGDFRIAYNSPLVSSGYGKYFTFDFNGYKSWYPSTFPTGPFLGIYRNPEITSDPLIFERLFINAGESTSAVPVVKLTFEYTGLANRYRAGESSDLSVCEWKEIAEINTYILSEPFGMKTVYAQLRGVIEESTVLSAQIEYVNLPIEISTIQINGNATFTYDRNVTIVLDCAGNEQPVSYRIGETEDLSSATWQDYIESIPYTLSEEYASKTIYVQVKTANNNISEIKSATIEYKKMPGLKILASIGWNSAEIKELGDYDSSTGFNRVVVSGSKTLKSTIGNNAGTVMKSYTNGQSTTAAGTKGKTTGDNSGIYPDIYLEKNVCILSKDDGVYYQLHFTIPEGRYRINLFCNTIHQSTSAIASNYAFVIDAGLSSEEAILFPSPTVLTNNLMEKLKLEVDVPQNGFDIKWYLSSPAKTLVVPLNIIEIEEV